MTMPKEETLSFPIRDLKVPRLSRLLPHHGNEDEDED